MSMRLVPKKPSVNFAITLAILLIAGAVHAANLPLAEMPPQLDAAYGSPVIANGPTLPPPDKLGVSNAQPAPSSAYFPILPFGADPEAQPQLLPVASNHPLGEDHTNVTRGIIVVHDVSRDAGSMLSMMTVLAGSGNDAAMIVAPQFLLESDIAHFADKLPNGGKGMARWAWGAWIDGGESTAVAPQKGVSSFTALDLILLYLGDREFFPNLKDVVVVGNGAGGDFVLRYAAVGQAPDLIGVQGVVTHFVAANPSSYLYYTPMRPMAGKPGFSMPDASACAGYDAYRYGINNLNDYARRIGVNEIRLRYPSRQMVYLIGDKSGVDDRFPDTNCAAMMQGPDRFTRAKNYNLYLSTIFGDDIARNQSFSVVPNVGSEPNVLFGSRCGMSALFGDGSCAPPVITGAGIP